MRKRFLMLAGISLVIAAIIAGAAAWATGRPKVDPAVPSEMCADGGGAGCADGGCPMMKQGGKPACNEECPTAKAGKPCDDSCPMVKKGGCSDGGCAMMKQGDKTAAGACPMMKQGDKTAAGGCPMMKKAGAAGTQAPKSEKPASKTST